MIRMRNNRVLVKRIPIPEKTKGGIILPLQAIELPQLAHVISIGPINPEQIQPGDMVLIKKFEGHRWEKDGEVFHLMHISDLLAVIKD